MEYNDYKAKLDKALADKEIDQERYDQLMEGVEFLKDNE